MGLSAICDHMVDSWYRLVRKDVVVGCADTRKRCCSESGMFLLLYRQAMVHAKTATIDSAWSTVGTAKMGRLSLVGNFEVNVEVYDRAMACRMEDIFSKDASNAPMS